MPELSDHQEGFSTKIFSRWETNRNASLMSRNASSHWKQQCATKTNRAPAPEVGAKVAADPLFPAQYSRATYLHRRCHLWFLKRQSMTLLVERTTPCSRSSAGVPQSPSSLRVPWSPQSQLPDPIVPAHQSQLQGVGLHLFDRHLHHHHQELSNQAQGIQLAATSSPLKH